MTTKNCLSCKTQEELFSKIKLRSEELFEEELRPEIFLLSLSIEQQDAHVLPVGDQSLEFSLYEVCYEVKVALDKSFIKKILKRNTSFLKKIFEDEKKRRLSVSVRKILDNRFPAYYHYLTKFVKIGDFYVAIFIKFDKDSKRKIDSEPISLEKKNFESEVDNYLER